MDFIDKIRQLSKAAKGMVESIQTEEATKTAIIMPFLTALGYNVFDPSEVTPEFISDVGIKKGEKIDYAILDNGSPTILIECKWCGTTLDLSHISQLFRYFSVTPARIGILTNGKIFQFFADLEEKNKMDSKPFFVFDLLSFDEASVKELQKFSKAAFNTEIILPAAAEMKYTNEMKKVLSDQLIEPEDDFVRYLAGKVYNGRLGRNVMQDFSGIVKKSFSQFIRDQVNERLAIALEAGRMEEKEEELSNTGEEETLSDSNDGIVTTQDEIDGFYVIRAIASEITDPSMIVMRDSKSYCAILYGDNNRRPVCRLRFNSAQKYLGLFDQDKNEDKISIDRTSDIFKFSGQIRETISRYVGENQ